MTLDQYLSGLASPTEEEKRNVWDQVTTALVEEGLEHVRNNIESECRVSEEVWDDLFAALDDTEEESVRETLTEVFQNWIQHGPEISDTPRPKGRAVDANRFLNWLDDQNVFASPSGKRRFLDDVQSNSSSTSSLHLQLQQLWLGKHLMWSTFHEEETDPFTEWDTAQEVRIGLGLTKPTHPDDQKPFLLVYRIPSDVVVRYPTIADAYAGEGEWNPNFQCAPPDAPWGYTSGDAPEVVHEVIPGAHLIDPEVAPVAAVRIMD